MRATHLFLPLLFTASGLFIFPGRSLRLYPLFKTVKLCLLPSKLGPGVLQASTRQGLLLNEQTVCRGLSVALAAKQKVI